MNLKFLIRSFILISFICFIVIGCGGKLSEGQKTVASTSVGASAYEKIYPQENAEQTFKLETKVKEYRGKGLYDFLNGGAELYFAYDIVAAASAEYKAGQNSIIEVTIYDMGAPANAFGMYSIGRYSNAEYVSIGNEGIKTAWTLDFWKGRYYCKLVSFDDAAESQQSMVVLGAALANNIKESGALPELITLLPKVSKVSKSEKYFRKQLALNNIHYVDSENVLQLSGQTEGVVAKYQSGETKVDGFVIKYPASEDADAAYISYLTYLSQKGKVENMEAEKSARVVLQDGKVTFVAHRDKYLIGVWNAQGKEDYEFVEETMAAIEGG